ncbi:hypothetical protein C3495_14425 (plasmid) [Clostridiaceae bacterium 14S0207]|nr:hypothetical protein C3495_14425 [Clostridiaceae bacterium 14S0207]
MKNNPYADLLNIIKDNSPQPNLILLGIILSSDPLRIKIGDLILYRENLLVNVDIKNLLINDTVAVTSIENGQKYIVLAKVV